MKKWNPQKHPGHAAAALNVEEVYSGAEKRARNAPLVKTQAVSGCGDAGVSYLFRTDRGALLFDVGFGPERPALEHNAAKL
jgi:hypothetical protein